ncbi:MAG: hypothetical protein L5657_10070, partial [Calditerricola sp.]|nr:hypothetical protein [Calditerricola sp.]
IALRRGRWAEARQAFARAKAKGWDEPLTWRELWTLVRHALLASLIRMFGRGRNLSAEGRNQRSDAAHAQSSDDAANAG